MILDWLVAIAPYFQQLMLEDAQINVTDTEKFLVTLPGSTLDMKVQPNDPIRDGSLIAVAMNEKRRIVQNGNKELYGIAHQAVCVPIFEDNQVVGCIAIAYSKEKSDHILQMAHSLANMSEQISSGASTVASTAYELVGTYEAMARLSSDIRGQMDEISKVTSIVTELASQTNLLGLNATIQASHAGEQGRGFSVVAQEVRILAERSRESSGMIKTQLDKTTYLIEKILHDIDTVTNHTQEQAGASEQLAATVEELNRMAQRLKEISSFDL